MHLTIAERYAVRNEVSFHELMLMKSETVSVLVSAQITSGNMKRILSGVDIINPQQFVFVCFILFEPKHWDHSYH